MTSDESIIVDNAMVWAIQQMLPGVALSNAQLRHYRRIVSASIEALEDFRRGEPVGTRIVDPDEDCYGSPE